MPTYTVRRRSKSPDSDTASEWDIQCSHEELGKICEEYDLVHVPKFPAIVTGSGRSHPTAKTDDAWKDHLKEMKKKSGKGNTINI